MVRTTYKTFDLEIRRLIWIERDGSEHPKVVLEFKKKKAAIDDLIDLKRKIVNDLMRVSAHEIPGLHFAILPTGGFGHESLKVYYQKGTYNPDWEKQHRISPLSIAKTIYIEKGQQFHLIEYYVATECYERKNDTTVLKEN